ncbi:pdxT, partial [Acrasis kona]
MYVRTLLIAVILLRAVSTRTISWTECPVVNPSFPSINMFQQPDNGISFCGVQSLPYNYSNSNNVTLRHKLFLSPSPKGNVILIGDSIIGNSGEGIEQIGFFLYKSLSNAYNVYIPGLRGTNDEALSMCSGQTGLSLDRLGTINCQNDPLYGDYDGLTVDMIASDVIEFINQVTLKYPDIPFTYYGRGFGSYIVNRILTMNKTN